MVGADVFRAGQRAQPRGHQEIRGR
jgi:hypothetical protein